MKQHLVAPGEDEVIGDRQPIGTLGPDLDGFRNLAPGQWTPHVTLGRRLTGEQVGAALAGLDGPADADVTAVGCRRWDGDARRAWLLHG